MKYISIDCETTGLNPVLCNILEFGAVIEDTENWKVLEELPTFRRLLNPPKDQEVYFGEPGALAMHPKLFTEIDNGSEDLIDAEDLALEFMQWLFKNDVVSSYGHPIVVAGKNFGNFDLQFLRELPNWVSHVNIHHAILDPGPIFWNPYQDKFVPGLQTCMNRAGTMIDSISHTAVEDALVVIAVLRRRYNYLKDVNQIAHTKQEG